jgi:Domain of Unknown Function with PDB structure (DUF3857)
MKSKLSLIFSFLIFNLAYSQNLEYTVLKISDSLKQNANAVIRLNQLDINISSQRKINIKNKRVVTVYNEKGLSAVDAIENYSKASSIINIEAKIFNAFGMEIKKIKRKDFRDQSAVDGGTLFSDNRLIYLDYTPTEYPFTIVYDCEIESSNTAFIPQWIPLSGYFVSLEKSVLNINYPPDLGFKKKEFNFENYKIKKIKDTEMQLSYEATNILALREEYYSSGNYDFLPRVIMGLEHFNLEGLDGNAKTWKEFGQWYSDKILTGTTELSDETKAKIKSLVGNETDNIKKAKIIYKYVQQKSRYVSIQVGIGGWKPMLAKDVDRLGYGDCKALSNYTRALLNVVNVPSYNTILYGQSSKKDIESDFVSMQGNHMILSIPDGDKYIWLECTSQDAPFGYQANFTDDRNVIVIKPEGGEIVRTKTYNDKDNSQTSKGNYTLSENGDFAGSITIISEGAQYSSKSDLETMQPTNKEAHYKKYWSNINNLKINKTSFSNNKENVSFSENSEISAINYGTISANKILFVVNAFNQFTGNIKKVRNRKTPFEIERGFYDNDEIAMTMPTGFLIEAMPNNFELKTKFGEYKTEIVKKDDTNLVYKRTLFVKKGLYANKEYEDYRLFMEQVSRNDNARMILIKK